MRDFSDHGHFYFLFQFVRYWVCFCFHCPLANQHVKKVVPRIAFKIVISCHNKQIDKIWKNPKKAQNAGLLLFTAALLGWALFGAFLIMDDAKDSNHLIESLLENMDCQSLKDVIKNNDLQYYKYQNLVQKYMLTECL